MSKKQINLLNKKVFYFQEDELRESIAVRSKMISDYVNYYTLKNGDNCVRSRLFLTKKGAINNYIKNQKEILHDNTIEIMRLEEINMDLVRKVEVAEKRLKEEIK